MRLKDKVAIVTGAASGIGREIALTFAREGAKVAIADLDRAGANAVAREIGGGKALGVAMDVTDEGQVDAGFAQNCRGPRRRRYPGQQCRHPGRPAARSVRVRQVEAAARDPPRWRVPHHPRSPPPNVPPGPRRQHHLHGLGPLQGGLGAQGTLRDRQARPDRARQGRGQGGRRARRTRQRDLSGLRAHASGRQADPRAGARSSASPKRK